MRERELSQDCSYVRDISVTIGRGALQRNYRMRLLPGCNTKAKMRSAAKRTSRR
jgi:hypothetical protein